MKNQYQKRTDGNQKDIVRDLRRAGIQCILTNMGDDYPDLMIGSHGQWTLLEIKQPNGKFSRGQIEFIANAIGRVGFARTSEEALNVVCRPDKYCISLDQRLLLMKWLIEHPTQQTLSVNQFEKVIV